MRWRCPSWCTKARRWSFWSNQSRGFAACQKFAHAVERLEDFLGRVGVGQPHIAFAEHPEVRSAYDRHPGVLEQRRGERLRLPAGALDIREGVERPLRD